MAELAVEVPDWAVIFDLGNKATLYTSAELVEWWVVLIPERELVIHRDPDPAAGVYRRSKRLRDGAGVSPLAAPGAAIPIVDLLP